MLCRLNESHEAHYPSQFRQTLHRKDPRLQARNQKEELQAVCDAVQMVTSSADTMLSSNSLKRRIEEVEQDGAPEDGGRLQIRHFESLIAQDHARQHNGDQYFYGTVNFQDTATSPEVERSVRESKLAKILESLVFEHMDSRFMDVRPNLVGTCEWLLNTPEYKKWQDRSLRAVHHGLLWIKGNAGSGKSTLMKFVSDLAEARHVEAEYNLIFFFNARGTSTETSSNGLFRSMLHQLLEKIPHLLDLLDERRLKIAERRGWSPVLLRDVFRDAITHLEQDRVTCYIDAMDECSHEEVEDVVWFLEDLVDFAVGQAKQFYICLSSRHYPNLEISHSVELVLQHQQGHADDIRRYIRKRLAVSNEDLKTHLTKVLETKASGVFLWIVLVVELLNRDSRRGYAHEILKRLDQIPAKLSDLFEELLGRGTCSAYLPSLLRWASFSRQPLTPEQLYIASMSAAQNIGSPHMTNGDLESVTQDTVENFILDSSKGLVEIIHVELGGRSIRLIRFIHESVRTYFLKEGIKYLTSDCDAVTIDTAECGILNLGFSPNAIMIAHCYDQLKHCCLFYLTEYVLKSVRLPDSLPNAISVEMVELKGHVTRSHSFFEHAIKGVFGYAELSHHHGLQQRDFLDSLAFKEIGALHQIGGPYRYNNNILMNGAAWYKARLLIISGCSELADTILETIPHHQRQLCSGQNSCLLDLRPETSRSFERSRNISQFRTVHFRRMDNVIFTISLRVRSESTCRGNSVSICSPLAA
jgi:hypothetical protein